MGIDPDTLVTCKLDKSEFRFAEFVSRGRDGAAIFCEHFAEYHLFYLQGVTAIGRIGQDVRFSESGDMDVDSFAVP